MSEENQEDLAFAKSMVKKYWYMLILLVVGVVGIIVGGLLTLNFVITNTTVGGEGTWTLAEFSLGTGILLCLWVLLWEFLFVVLPVIAYFGIIIGLWWVNLPEDEKTKIKERDSKEKTATRKANEGGGVFGFIIFITFLILVTIDGNLFTPFGDLSYTYWIMMWLSAVFWLCTVIGVPVLIGGLIYIGIKWKEW